VVGLLITSASPRPARHTFLSSHPGLGLDETTSGDSDSVKRKGSRLFWFFSCHPKKYHSGRCTERTVDYTVGPGGAYVFLKPTSG
jgi:hypothetical protein